jgi:hypothetical protein
LSSSPSLLSRVRINAEGSLVRFAVAGRDSVPATSMPGESVLTQTGTVWKSSSGWNRMTRPSAGQR